MLFITAVACWPAVGTLFIILLLQILVRSHGVHYSEFAQIFVFFHAKGNFFYALKRFINFLMIFHYKAVFSNLTDVYYMVTRNLNLCRTGTLQATTPSTKNFILLLEYLKKINLLDQQHRFGQSHSQFY